jgi:DNA-binding CsgD family transcriptional regulator
MRVGEPLPEPYARWLRAERARPVSRPLVRGGVVARLVAGGADGFDAIVLTQARPGISAPTLRAIGLTAREADVLALVAAGLTNSSVANRLGIRESTVAKHVQHINEKLGTPTRTAAVARAREMIHGAN